MISIVIPLFNTSKYLKKCLDSIISQSYTDWECILVDDCSTDDSLDIALEYMSKDRRFKVHKNSENLGCGLTRRRAISLAKGEVIGLPLLILMITSTAHSLKTCLMLV